MAVSLSNWLCSYFASSNECQTQTESYEKIQSMVEKKRLTPEALDALAKKGVFIIGRENSEGTT
ncbi:MAG: hypothetical protein COT84_06370 [Chlamydiae bacterium CG10_big_fil_rev_8_21_14_0_10_35_9]|nr:MAG: hypothetical protein COT84_06370 [Chlamydiae bacterium CG10_big_fil_rev_8_21_14_0_10_35_9]